MNVCKFYKRNKDGTVTVLRIKVTQSNAAHRGLDLRPKFPYVAQARRFAANKGFSPSAAAPTVACRRPRDRSVNPA
jgi:hypothetical protein